MASPNSTQDSGGFSSMSTTRSPNITGGTNISEDSHALPYLGTTSQWQDISNYSEFMNSLISFLNVSHGYMSHVRSGLGRSPTCSNPVSMNEEERQLRMTEIIAKLEEKFAELRDLEAQRRNMSDASAPQDSRLATMGSSGRARNLTVSSAPSSPSDFNPPAGSTGIQQSRSIPCPVLSGSQGGSPSSKNTTGSSGLQSTRARSASPQSSRARSATPQSSGDQSKLIGLQSELKERYADVARLEEMIRNISRQQTSFPSPDREAFSPNAASSQIHRPYRGHIGAPDSYMSESSDAYTGSRSGGSPYSWGFSTTGGGTTPCTNPSCPGTTIASRSDPFSASSRFGGGGSFSYGTTSPSPRNITWQANQSAPANLGETYIPLSQAGPAPQPSSFRTSPGNATYSASGSPGAGLYKASGSPTRFSPPATSSRCGDSSGVPSSYYSQDSSGWPANYYSGGSAYGLKMSDGSSARTASSARSPRSQYSGSQPRSQFSTTQPRTITDSSLGLGCFTDCTGTSQYAAYR